MVVACAALLALTFAANPAPCQYSGGFAAGLSQGLERGAAIRERRAEAAERYQAAHRLALCNKALENYLVGKGPTPPPMCDAPAGASARVADPPPATASAATPAPPAFAGPTFTNCLNDAVGGTYCTTTGGGPKSVFTNCTTDTLGNRHCVAQ
jgi:hypothetical protein